MSTKWTYDDFPEVQWLGLCAFTAKDLGSLSGQGAKTPWAAWHSQKKKKPCQNWHMINVLSIIDNIQNTETIPWSLLSGQSKHATR